MNVSRLTSQRAFRWFVTLAGHALMLAAFYLLVVRLGQDTQHLAADLARMRGLPVAGALFSTLAMLVLMGLGWVVALRAVGVPIPLRTGFAIYYQTSILRYLPGAVWNFPGRAYLCLRQGISLATFAQSTFLELFFLLGSGAILAGFGLASYLGQPVILALSGAAATAMAGVMAWPDRVLSLGSRRPLASPAVDRRALGAMLMIYSSVWFAYGGAISLLLHALPGIRPPDLLQMVVLNTAAWAAGFLSLSPAGLGVRELGLSVMLGPALSAVVVVASLSQRVMELLLEALLWVVAKFMIGLA